MKIKRGDMVQIIAGDDAGGAPKKVLQVIDSGRKVVVEGVNRVYKHVRRGHPKSPQGGRLSREMPIDISNVLLYCNTCGRGVRVGFQYKADGSKTRRCKKCQAELGVVSPPKARYAGRA
ncbi:MAG TPA: 50S ribosomal protein L24 [Planctomycetaceae bacterium]|nr:50S ribosomal protein L24 [Planctomycetaceae bacterium]